jgi:hypothetical protein
VRLPFRHTGNRLFANTRAISVDGQDSLAGRHQSHASNFAKVPDGRKQAIRGLRETGLPSLGQGEPFMRT